jgi:hypothetical protein
MKKVLSPKEIDKIEKKVLSACPCLLCIIRAGCTIKREVFIPVKGRYGFDGNIRCGRLYITGITLEECSDACHFFGELMILTPVKLANRIIRKLTGMKNLHERFPDPLI